MTTDDNGDIQSLAINEVIVVGTNKKGLHGGGAAYFAYKRFGLVWGCGEGLSGQTYALPTMEGLDELQAAAERFMRFARQHPHLSFYLTRVGCGIAGYTDEQIAPLFGDAPKNVVLPEGWPKESSHPTPYTADELRKIVEDAVRHARMNAVMVAPYSHNVAEDNILLNVETIMAACDSYTNDKVEISYKQGYNDGRNQQEA